MILLFNFILIIKLVNNLDFFKDQKSYLRKKNVINWFDFIKVKTGIKTGIKTGKSQFN